MGRCRRVTAVSNFLTPTVKTTGADLLDVLRSRVSVGT